MNPVFCLAAGGSGGHVFPALALAGEIHRRHGKAVLLSDSRGARYCLLGKKGTPADLVVLPWQRKNFLSLIVALVRTFFGARAQLRNRHAQAVISFGGLFAIPVVMAAFSSRIPVILHEQNALMGRANRILSPFVRTIALSCAGTQKIPFIVARHKIRHTGLPLRPGLKLRAWQSPNRLIEILVIGGSQGASAFSRLIPRALALLERHYRSHFRMNQQCREEDMAGLTRKYRDIGVEAHLAPFFDDLPERMGKSHVVISRAGANSLAEILHMCRPAIIIPLPAALDNHQYVNAKLTEKTGGIFLIEEQSGDADRRLASLLKDFVDRPTILDDVVRRLYLQRDDEGEAARYLADLVPGIQPSIKPSIKPSIQPSIKQEVRS